MPGFDLILFDCDGVLVDSEIIAAEVESKLLRDSGFDITTEDMCIRFAGMDWKSILLTIEQEADIPVSAQLLDKSEKLLDAALLRRVKMIEGVRYALAKITEQRCICSNSSSHRLDLMLTKVGLKPFFEGHIYSAKDLGPDRTKPKPDIYLFSAWRACGTCRRHAGDRLYRRLAHLSDPCRSADGRRRRDRDLAHGGTAADGGSAEKLQRTGLKI
jgi:beta-phosphoglucomutase-like phosphatase (HAD superfamily)